MRNHTRRLLWLTLIIFSSSLFTCGPSSPPAAQTTSASAQSPLPDSPAPPTQDPYAPPPPPTEGPPPTQPTSPPPPTPLPTFTPRPTPLVVSPTPYAPPEEPPAGLPVVVYLVMRGTDPAQLWTLRYEGGLLQEELLHERVWGAERAYRLSVSPDGQYIAVSSEGEGSAVVTTIIATDGSTYVPDIPEFGGVTLLAWIPDSERFVWRGTYGANWGTVAIDGSASVLSPVYDVVDAVVTPDGNRIIFSTRASAGMQLGAIDVDGSNLTPFSLPHPLPGTQAHNMALSPTGQTCAFTWWNSQVSTWGTGRIWIMEADGSNQRPLGPGGTGDFGLAWSPEGNSIVFSRQENTEGAPKYDPGAMISSLWLVSVENGQEQLLLASEGQYGHWSPQWLPDGSGLVFLSNRGGDVNVWLVLLDGSGLQQLTRQGGLIGSIAVMP